MINESYKDKQKKLYSLIKKVSDKNGGDDIEWLKDYAKDVFNEWSHDLDKSIKCFENLI